MKVINYWTRDKSRKEIITKNLIPNAGDFDLYATYYNLMDKKGLSFPLNFENDLVVEKLYRKNIFEYIVLEHNGQQELYILPNEILVEFSDRVASKIDDCNAETEVLDLLIAEM